MSALADFVQAAAALAFSSGALCSVLLEVKYLAPRRVALSRSDARAIALVSALGGLALALVPSPLVWLVPPLAAVVFAGLILDVALYRLFTNELGPGGLASTIFSELYVEAAGLTSSRTFFRTHRALLFAPLAALLAHALVLLPRGFAALFAAYLVVLLATTPIRARAVPAMLGALSIASLFAFEAAAIAGGLALVAALFALRRGDSHDLRYFVVPRRTERRPGFRPHPADAALLEEAPRRYRPSPRHGLARSANVIVLSFESVGRDHLRAATMPFWASISAGGVVSRHHCAISPTTNNAHASWYTGEYRKDAPGHLGALTAAGYRTVYMTAADTQHYGLGKILRGAGFTDIIDAPRFEPRAADGRRPSDWVLAEQGAAALEALLDRDAPFFLHVHAANAHIPYRVVDRERFSRHDHGDDFGRFCNSIEETDAVFGALFSGLAERGLTERALIVVTSDHGQSFGELGYLSHGSAVTKEQIAVPFALKHPALPAEELAFSSHFDLLPTVLDLLGIPAAEAGFGDSVFQASRAPALLVWDGNPSRFTTANYGAILSQRKIMADLIRDRVVEADLEDRDLRELQGLEKNYALDLLAEVKHLRGVE